MFMNGPTRGQDVFMPLDFIIGGPAMAGQGWRMLMECLAAGRSISLPSSNTGMSKLTARAVGAMPACAAGSAPRWASSRASRKRWRASAATPT